VESAERDREGEEVEKAAAGAEEAHEPADHADVPVRRRTQLPGIHVVRRDR
jgi:hypothetical protein